MLYNDRYIAKEDIKQRMKEHIKRTWGVRYVDTRAYDSLVELLIGALAQELEDGYNDILNAEERTLERLTKLLLPNVLNQAKPAHAIVRMRPSIEKDTIRRNNLVFTEKKIIDSYNSTVTTKQLYFSPVTAIPLLDADVKYLASNGEIFLSDAFQNRRYAKTTKRSLAPNTLWLGLQVNPKIKDLSNASFFFNIPEEIQDYFFKILPSTKWSIQDETLAVETGISTDNSKAYINILERQLNPILDYEQSIIAIYESRFIRFSGKQGIPITPQKQGTPNAFKAVFSKTVLKALEDDIFWIKIEFPHFSNPRLLSKVQCFMNCIPVLNRRLETKSLRLRDSINIFPLNHTDSYFLGIENITDTNEKYYRESPFETLEKKAGTYSIRQGGMERFNARNANELLRHLLGLLRSDRKAFQAFNPDLLRTDLKVLEQTVARIEQQLDNLPDIESTYFLKIRKEDSPIAYVKYWTTNGIEANGLSREEVLKSHSSSIGKLQLDSLQLMTIPRSGKNKLEANEQLQSYKQQLLTKDRIVTIEDVKTFCYNYLGEKIAAIQVKRGTSLSTLPNEGLIRIIEVNIEPSYVAQNLDWGTICRNLKQHLEQHSTGVLPFSVKNCVIA